MGLNASPATRRPSKMGVFAEHGDLCPRQLCVALSGLHFYISLPQGCAACGRLPWAFMSRPCGPPVDEALPVFRMDVTYMRAWTTSALSTYILPQKKENRNRWRFSLRFRLLFTPTQPQQAKGAHTSSRRPDALFPFVFTHEKITGISNIQNRRIVRTALPRVLLVPKTTHHRKCRRVVWIILTDIDIRTGLELIFL